VAVGINVGHMRPVLGDVEARIVVHELREDRPGRSQASARSAAAKIEAENAQPPPGTPVELTADEMAAVKQALDEIGRELGLDPTPNLRELRARLRVELERDERL
jgi:ubiquinone biosynthesis protein UbiJ